MTIIKLSSLKHFLILRGRSFFLLLACLIGLRMILPYGVKWYVNKTLNEIKAYQGEIQGISLSLWRGSYLIRGVRITKTTGNIAVPFFFSEKVELSLEWRALFHGSLVGKIKCDAPVMNFVKGATLESSQVGVDQPWFEVIKKLFPLAINRCEINKGTIHYRDFLSTPPINLRLDQIHLLIYNLTNSEKLSKSLVATISMEGRAFEESAFILNAHINPWIEKPTFDLNFKLDPVSLTKLNDFSQAYGKFDFATGTMAITSELAASNGLLVGYVKPLLDHVTVLQIKDLKNPLQFTWKGIVGGFLRLFRNLPKDRFATKIPIYGTFDLPQISILPTLGNILKNEFIEVYTTAFEYTITVEKAAEKVSSKKKEISL